MNTPLSNSIGILAASLTTISLLPQVVKTLKTKRTRDLSLGMLVVFNVGILFWITYGIIIKSIPIIFGNCVTVSFAFYLLVMKHRYK